MRLWRPIFLLIMCAIFLIMAVIPTHARQIILTEGMTLNYKGAIISTAAGNPSTWAELIKISTYNQTTLIFQRTLANESSHYTVKYKDGFPIYVDYVPNLIYLPTQSLVESLKGNLDWAVKIETQRGATITNPTIQKLNFTVEAGSFQCVNLTLTLSAGLDYGNLSFLYDLDSGLLIYQQWMPAYGDIIVYELASATLAYGSLSIINMVMPSITLSIPLATLIHQAYRRYSAQQNRPKQKTSKLKNGFPKKPFYILIAGTVLSIVSIFTPWSQYAAINVYLISGFPLTMSEYIFFPSTDTFLIMSLTAQAAAIIASLSIPIYLHINNRLAPQTLTIVSSILSFISAFIFFQTKWASYWGLQIMVAGGILLIIGIAAANIKIEIVTGESK
ncbi:MAG: hypothetical protein QXX08_01580 [Candidatus Bathyarchaeia archaeon]